jgi:hypothetical protein
VKALEARWLEQGAPVAVAGTILALKAGDHRPLVDHVRGLLGDDLKKPGQSLRVAGKKLVVRTTAANHARIDRFLGLLAKIPGPPR